MQKQNGKLVYSPSDLIAFFDSPFASWMDRLTVERPGDLKPDKPEATLAVAAAKGVEHESRYLTQIRESGADVWSPSADGDKFAQTLAAMREGRGVVYQAALRNGDFAGYADFLFREPVPSPALGAFSYTVADTKLAKKAKPYFLIQLCAYAEMLEVVQGFMPEQVHIILGTGEKRAFRTADYLFYYRALKGAFLEQQAHFDPDNMPTPDGRADDGRWSSRAEALLKERDDLSRVANITKGQIKKLREARIESTTALANTEIQRVSKLDPGIFVRLKAQAGLQLRSDGHAVPEHQLLPADPNRPRRGLSLLPPASDLDIYFDMEGYPYIEGGLEYLFGASHFDGGALAFKDFWAVSKPDEQRAFEEFIDWAHARFVRDPHMHIYHYAAYEVSTLRRLMGQYGTRENELDALLRGDVFVDLYQVVRQALLVGEPRYSLKNIEHLYQGARGGEVSTAGDSVAEFARWLEERDGDDWQRSKILAGIRDYNRDDCESTAGLCKWLRQRQAEAGRQWVPPPKKDESQKDTQAKPRDLAEALAKRLRGAIPEDRSADPERWRLQELLAHLAEFHRREAKPVHWRKFERQKMTDDEIYDDVECLARLVRTPRSPIKVKLSTAYEYAFDPDQDTKRRAGDDVFFADGLEWRACGIDSFDGDAGLVTVKVGAGKPPPPELLSLIPDEFVGAEAIADSIYRTVEAWERTGKLPAAIEGYLMRRPPRVVGRLGGLPICPPGQAFTAAAVDAAASLNSSTLSIQGPPGAGKTYTAARIIIRLLKDGRRVGVTSNSHKAILKLIDEVLKLAKEDSTSLTAIKIGGDKDEPLVMSGKVQRVESIKKIDFSSLGRSTLVGGTAWAFSAPEAVGNFDHLFVDEAGQVSVANLLGMAPAATNLVLLGDQMQLGQPIQGSHPVESGCSVLEYLMQEHRTVPPELGLFLGTTYRLHPDICTFISQGFYEGRLAPELHTKNRLVRLPKNGVRLVDKEAGIVFVAKPHDGNARGSDEEVAVILEIVKELLGRELTDDNGNPKSALVLADILFIAPFNVQVLKLRAALGQAFGGSARVASVDKFQGQEAPVVILSMCASAGEPTPRGIEFLFSHNRMNVALSRAQSLAIVVGDPGLALTKASSIEQMRLVNLFARLVGPSANGVPV